MKLGAIADDFTGATDLASTLVKGGMRTTQFIGVPGASASTDCEAGVVALKSRTIDPANAVTQSLAALDWLQSQGAEQIIFKYCSTFDSTPRGNIGPVADALLDALGEDIAVVCPAFPTNKRTIRDGNLFVGDELLSDSSMKDHPLTPMTDANLIRVMNAQSAHTSGLVDLATVRDGAASVREKLKRLRSGGHRYAVLDALKDNDLMIAGEALKDAKLITGGSGIALGLPANFGAAADRQITIAREPGTHAVLAGSCSVATRGQIAHAMAHGIPAMALDPLALGADTSTIAKIARWARREQAASNGPLLIYSSADPADIEKIQRQLGRDAAGNLVEQAFAEIARQLVTNGTRNLVVAGGETSGAVVEGLAITDLEIGQEIDPGVPWTRARTNATSITLALKSGNFGTEDFFTKSFAKLG